MCRMDFVGFIDEAEEHRVDVTKPWVGLISHLGHIDFLSIHVQRSKSYEKMPLNLADGYHVCN
jgi:hypothetical protein